MKQNKLLKNALLNRKTNELHYGFENQLMRRVYLEAEKKKKESFVLSMSLISLVSLLMIVATFYILKIYFSFSFQIHLPEITITSQSISFFGFSCYIALVILALLGLDGYFRSIRQRRQEK